MAIQTLNKSLECVFNRQIIDGDYPFLSSLQNLKQKQITPEAFQNLHLNSTSLDQFVMLFDQQNRLLSKSQNTPDVFRPMEQGPLSKLIRYSASNQSHGHITVNDKDYIYTYRKIPNQLGSLVIAVPQSVFDQSVEHIWDIMFITLGISSLIIAALAVQILNYLIISPLHKLNSVTHNIKDFNYTETIPVNTKDEFGMLARNMEKMSASLLAKDKQIQKAVEEIESSELQFRETFENSPFGMALVSTEKKWLLSNRATLQMLGYETEQDFINQPISNVVCAKDLNLFSELLEKINRNDPCDHFIELRFIHKSKTSVWVRAGVTLIRDKNDAPVYFILQFQDISERKKVELDAMKLLAAIEQADESVVITNLDGFIEYTNPATEEISGYKRDDLIGKKPSVFKSGEQPDKFYEEMWSKILTGKVWRNKLINRKKDGNTYNEEMTISPVKNKLGNISHFVAVKRDITHDIQLEQHMSRSQKLEAIGTLAGGIAHDFNNMLFAMILGVQLAYENTPEGHKNRGILNRVMQATTRAKGLIRQILTFSRQSEQTNKIFDMRLILKEALHLIRATMPSTLTIRQNITSEAAFICADPSQVHQIILNLCTNAEYAMRPNNGTLGIELKQVTLSKNEAEKLSLKEKEDYIMLRVSDTGTGIPENYRERIFDPFFTSKPPGEGTGMGLSVVHGIIKKMSGTVTFETEAGKGTTFYVYMPAAEFSDTENTATISFPDLPRGTESILIVDDEILLIEMQQVLLENLGYKVTITSESTQALEWFQESPERFDLVITDLTMPNLRGDELAKKILEIKPDFPVILMTGFSHALEEEQAREIGIKEYLMKPILNEDLSKAVRSALD